MFRMFTYEVQCYIEFKAIEMGYNAIEFRSPSLPVLSGDPVHIPVTCSLNFIRRSCPAAYPSRGCALLGTLCLSRRSSFPLACTKTHDDIFSIGHFSPCGDSTSPDD